MNMTSKRFLTGASLFLLLYIFTFYFPPLYFSLILIAIFTEILIFEWPPLLKNHSWSFRLITFLYPLIPFACLIIINNYSQWLMFILVSLVALFDTFSYIAGKMIGKHKIAPRISPGKTWEGVFGGFSAVFVGILSFSAHKNLLHIPFIAILALIISCLALAGDLLESWFKRKAGIKHSGSLLPGHGGLLDRIDGLMIVAIFFAIFKKYLLNFFN